MSTIIIIIMRNTTASTRDTYRLRVVLVVGLVDDVEGHALAHDVADDLPGAAADGEARGEQLAQPQRTRGLRSSRERGRHGV